VLFHPILDKLTGGLGGSNPEVKIRGDFKIRLRCSFPVAYDGRCVWFSLTAGKNDGMSTVCLCR